VRPTPVRQGLRVSLVGKLRLQAFSQILQKYFFACLKSRIFRSFYNNLERILWDFFAPEILGTFAKSLAN
jgi:hypothetical protein